MKITQEVRAFAMEQAGRRYECTEGNCRHHLRGARCKKGLRDGQWRVFWRTEKGGVTRENIVAWCVECFHNNFSAPKEAVALFASDLVGYAGMAEKDPWQASTLKSVLRDAASRVARDHHGRVVLGRRDDDVLVEFPTSLHAVEAARGLRGAFQDLVGRLGLHVPELCGAIHCGEVTRWRNGLLAGDVVGETARVLKVAGVGQVVLTRPAAEPLGEDVGLQPVPETEGVDLGSLGGGWALAL